jgi:hypothetical protein
VSKPRFDLQAALQKIRALETLQIMQKLDAIETEISVTARVDSRDLAQRELDRIQQGAKGGR